MRLQRIRALAAFNGVLALACTLNPCDEEDPFYTPADTDLYIPPDSEDTDTDATEGCPSVDDVAGTWNESWNCRPPDTGEPSCVTGTATFELTQSGTDVTLTITASTVPSDVGKQWHATACEGVLEFTDDQGVWIYDGHHLSGWHWDGDYCCLTELVPAPGSPAEPPSACESDCPVP